MYTSPGVLAAMLTHRAFYDKNMKFGSVIPWTIPNSFGRGSNA